MRIQLPFALLAAVVFACSMHADPAQAQRVFVSATGSDSNPCSFASPCRSFQHAHDVVAANGEIDVLDPAGYGAVNIIKSISIQGHGFSGITATAGNAINVNAGVIKINLRGLLLDGGGTGTNGINFSAAGGILSIQDCQIRNFAGDGIFFGPSITNATAGFKLFVSNTVIADNGVNGVSIGPESGAPITWAALDHVQLVNNGRRGVAAFGGVNSPIFVLVSNSLSAFNGTDGVFAQGGGLETEVTVRNSSIFANGGNGLFVDGSHAVIRVSKSGINDHNIVPFGNFVAQNGGFLISFGDNSLDDNGSDGAPTLTAPLK
jgi:hypothetical protein